MIWPLLWKLGLGFYWYLLFGFETVTWLCSRLMSLWGTKRTKVILRSFYRGTLSCLIGLTWEPGTNTGNSFESAESSELMPRGTEFDLWSSIELLLMYVCSAYRCDSTVPSHAYSIPLHLPRGDPPQGHFLLPLPGTVQLNGKYCQSWRKRLWCPVGSSQVVYITCILNHCWFSPVALGKIHAFVCFDQMYECHVTVWEFVLMLRCVR